MDMPVFVKIHDPREVHDTIALLKLKLAEARETLDRIGVISEHEEQKVKEWNQKFGTVMQKMETMIATMHNPERI